MTTLHDAWNRSQSLLCVGLDPDPARLPDHLAAHPEGLLRFCTAIVDATADLVCAFKPQIAYFGAHGAETQLAALIDYIHQHHPGLPVILDAKRGDIGATAKQYAREAFERYQADAVTLSPFMGFDSIEPYLAYSDRGLILLCRTSNPGGSDLQSLDVGGMQLYEHIAHLAAGPWNQTGQLGLVVGATVPAELARVRTLAPQIPLLVPGIGAQGGDISATVQAGCNADGTGLLINASRAVLYATSGEAFAQGARAAARSLRDAINQARSALTGPRSSAP